MGDAFDAFDSPQQSQQPPQAQGQPAPAQPTAQASPAPSSTPTASPAPQDAFDAARAMEVVKNATPMGTISAYHPSVIERVGRMFTNMKESGQGYFREHPEEAPTGFFQPQNFMTESEKQDHPIVRGVSETLGGLTSPENIMLMVATEGLGAASPFLRGGLKIVPRLVSAGFGAQMLYGAYKEYPQFKAALDAGDVAESERFLTHIVLSGAMATLATQHAVRGDVHANVRDRKTQGTAVEEAQAKSGTQAGPRTTVRPTIQTTAGVEAPIAATQQDDPSALARVAQRFTSPGRARDFQKEQTLPAAQRQLTSALGQVMEDAIANHEAISSGEKAPEKLSGTQQVSKFQTLDEAAQAGQRAAKKTWQKGDEIDTRETQEWQRKADDVRNQVKEHNELVDEYNRNLGKGDTPMAKIDEDNPTDLTGKSLLPEKPKTLAELRSDWSRAKANSRSSDAAVRQKAFDEEVPNAEKSLDKWFKQHSDDISPEEYSSVKRLTFQHERMQELSNKLRGPMDTGTLTGNRLRNIEAQFNNRGAKFGRPNSFKELLGPEGYENWRNVAKVLDPLKGPNQIERGLEAFSTMLLGHFMPVGLAGKFGTEFILNRALFDPTWGKTFTKAYANFKLTGKVRPSDQHAINDLVRYSKLTDDELLKAGFSQEQIDKGEHLPNVGGGKPTAEEVDNRTADVANRFNEDRDRRPIRKVLPAVHPQGREIAEAYDAMKHDPSNPEVKKSYDALKNDIDEQWNHAEASGYTLEPWTGEGQPYANSAKMAEDVNQNRHLSFFTGGDMPADHPLAEVDPKTGLTYNDKFRAIHDLFGHAAHGHEFGPKGEEAAYRTHAQMFSPEAIPALTTETRGQNNWVNNGPHMQDANGNVLKKGQRGYLPPAERPYAEQKAGILPEKFHGDKHGVAQDIADYHNTNKGFTFNPNRGFVRDQPAFSVGIPEAPSHVFSKENLTAKDVSEFMSRPDVKKALDDDPRNSIGGWNYKGRAQLEVSRLFDDREDAIRAGKQNNQTSVFDHENQTEIPTGGTAGDDARKSDVERTIARMKEQYGTTSDPLKAGFILPEGDMIPLVGEHDQMLGGAPSDNLRESFIKDAGAIRSRYRMSRSGEEQVFSLPEEITEEQARQIKYAAGKLRNGRITLETVDGKNHEMLDFPTGQKVQEALDKMVRTKSVEPEVEAVHEPSDVNASGESAASQEAIGRVASEKAQGIKRVRVRPNGEEVPLIGTDAVDLKANRGETLVQRYPDGREVILDQGAGAKYSGPKQGDAFDAQADKLKRVANPKADTDFFSQAKKNLPEGSLSQQLQEAERLKRESAARVADVSKEAEDFLAQLSGKVGDNTASELPTRYPKGKNATAEISGDQHVDMDAMREASRLAPSRNTAAGGRVMGYDEKMARTVADYPGMKVSKTDLKDPQKVMSKFVDHVADNLEWLYNAMPENVKAAAKTWYDSANKIITDFANKHGVTPEQAAAVTAVLSPSNAWDNNVNLTRRMLQTWSEHQNTRTTPEMEKEIIDLGAQYPQFKPLLEQLKGKALSEVKNGDPTIQSVLKGLWIRLFDQAHNDSGNDLYSPNGDIVSKGAGNVAWQGNNALSKAVNILDNPSLKNINANLGQGHKVRNFYNNLINPNSSKGHVTIDTHAVSASLLTPMANDSLWASQNFGGSVKGTPRAPGSDPTGLKGTYPLYAEAYRRVAEKLGIKPRELQSVVWEGAKSLMQDKKTPDMQRDVLDIWDRVKKGRLTPDRARDMILDRTGGFSKPDWMRDEDWEKAGSAEGDTDFNFGANGGE